MEFWQYNHCGSAVSFLRWSEWEEWDSDLTLCSMGARTRLRRCVPVSAADSYCADECSSVNTTQQERQCATGEWGREGAGETSDVSHPPSQSHSSGVSGDSGEDVREAPILSVAHELVYLQATHHLQQ